MTNPPLTIAADQPRRQMGNLVLVRDGLVEPSVVARGYQLLRDHQPPEIPGWVSLEPTWLSSADLEHNRTPARVPGWPHERADEVWDLIRTLTRTVYGDVMGQLSQFVGFEVFVNRFPPSGHPFCAYHVDCDQGLVERDRVLRSPVWSGVVHLGPSSEVEGGELAVNTDGPASYVDWCAANPPPEAMPDSGGSSWMVIPPRANRLVVFASDYPHFVYPVTRIPPGEPRLSVVMIAWDVMPSGTDHAWKPIAE